MADLAECSLNLGQKGNAIAVTMELIMLDCRDSSCLMIQTKPSSTIVFATQILCKGASLVVRYD